MAKQEQGDGAAAAVAAGEAPAKAGKKASLGRVVHYVLPKTSPAAGEHRAATVAGVHEDGSVGLTVSKLNADDLDGDHEGLVGLANAATALVKGVNEDAGGAPGTWHWPEGA